MTKKCDNKSVGIVAKKNGKILLLERKKFPFGFAAPAGHVDDFPSPEDAAKGELNEETGLVVDSLKLVKEERVDNPCRRIGGDHHYWWIFEVEVSGEIVPSKDETKQVYWCELSELKQLAEKTEKYRNGEISEDVWEKGPGLEPVWYDWFKKLSII